MTWQQAPRCAGAACEMDEDLTRRVEDGDWWCERCQGWFHGDRVWPYRVDTWIGEEAKDTAERQASSLWLMEMGAVKTGVSARAERWDEYHERHFITGYFADATLAAAFKLRFGGEEPRS